MPITALGVKGYNHIWFHAAYMTHNLGDNLGWVSLIQVSINVIQKKDLTNTQYLSGCSQLAFTCAPQHIQARMLTLVAIPTAFAACGCDQIGFDTFSSVSCQYAPSTK